MGITKFVLKRPVTAILAVVCLLVFGLQSLKGMSMELTPDMEMSMMILMTRYSKASPEDVAELITKPLEDSVSTLSGLSSVSSTSSEGSSLIMLEYEYGTDMDKAYDDLKKKVDMVANIELPDDADTPAIIEMNSNASDAMSLVVDYPGKESLYNYVNNEVVPEFEKLSDVAEVSIMGGTEEYIKIELIEEKVRQYGVSMSSIAMDIAAADISYPAGTTDMGSQSLSLSTKMSYDTQEALGEIPLTTNSQSNVYLSDVARIYRTVHENDSIARYNGEDTVSVRISKQQSSTAMELSEEVHKVIDSLTRKEPGLTITVVDDSADSISSSLKSVAETLILAVIISMVIIWLFLGDLKASLIVGSSIPVSILVCLICMGRMGLTLNIITLCALTLGVGMMVDNSIVVLESCFRATDAGKAGFVEYMKDALEGTRVVGSSVMASTVTTCVVFLPLAMLKGMTGQMLGPLGYTIVFSMAASLLSSVTIVPLCYMLYRPREREKAPFSRPVVRIQNGYRHLMKKVLPRKKTVMACSVLLLVVAFKLAGQLKMELMASDDNGEVSVSIEVRPGLKTERMDEIVRQVEEIICRHEDLEGYMTTSGGTGMMGGSGDASITAYLKEDRSMETREVAAQWKREMADIANCNITVDVSGSMSMMSSFGEQFETILMGANYDEVKKVSGRIVEELTNREEVTRVHSDVENSSPVIQVTVDGAKAKAYGLSAAEIGSMLNQMVSGVEATELEEDGENISVMVEYPAGTYDRLDQIMGIVLQTKTGSSVLLTDVADVSFQDSPASIKREDKQYKVTVTAQYTKAADAGTQAKLNREVVTPNLTETVKTGLNSMDQSMNEEFRAIFGAIATAVFLIFVVMAMQFESLKFSLMVMVTIPFSLIGSFGLLWLADSAISMISLIGFLMLVGTVVNAGILYVDTVNQYRSTMNRDTALIEAGVVRMRPILMTTLTTIVSMVPMAFGWGSSGEMTKGLALVNIGGLTASTVLSLVMLPVFYSVMSRTPGRQTEKKVER